MFSSADMEEIARSLTVTALVVILILGAVFFGAGWFASREVSEVTKEPQPTVAEEPDFKYGDFVVVTSGFFEGAKGYVRDHRLVLGVKGEPTLMKYEVEFHKMPEGVPDLENPPEIENFVASELRFVPVFGPLQPLEVEP